MLRWVRNLKRKRLLRIPLPQHWIEILNQHIPFYPHLSAELTSHFHNLLKVFVWEKYFIGAQGFVITDEVRVVIGAVAVRLIIHLDLSYYDGLTEIVIYPNHYKHRNETGLMLGEAHHFGTVVLSWPAVIEGLYSPCDGHDTATHEFAHVLDRSSGLFSGTPPLRAKEHYRAWARVMSRHFLALQQGQHQQRMVLRDYGAKNEAEFFAVATEAFFEKPLTMQNHTPDLYEELKKFYGFDPVLDPTCGKT